MRRFSSLIIVSIVHHVEPSGGHPLRLSLQQIDLPEQLLICPIRIRVDGDHVEVVSVRLLHLTGTDDDLLQFFVVIRLGTLQFPSPEFFQRRGRNENDEGHQIGLLEDFQRLRVEIEYADLLRVNDGSDGLEAGAVIGFLVFSVLHKFSVKNVLLELRTGYEVVVLAVNLIGTLGT